MSFAYLCSRGSLNSAIRFFSPATTGCYPLRFLSCHRYFQSKRLCKARDSPETGGCQRGGRFHSARFSALPSFFFIGKQIKVNRHNFCTSRDRSGSQHFLDISKATYNYYSNKLMYNIVGDYDSSKLHSCEIKYLELYIYESFYDSAANKSIVCKFDG